MIQYGIIVGLVLLMYIRILPYDYIIDDQLVPKGKGKNFLHTFILQLTANKYCNRYVEHLQRILVHAGVCCLIYYCLGQDEMSFFAALMFSVNPINNNGVAWLNGIGYSMSAACVLLMLINPYVGMAAYMFSLWWHLTAFPAPLLFLAGYCMRSQISPWWFLMILVYIAVILLVKGKVPFGKSADDATLDNRWGIKGKKFKEFWWGKLIFVIKTYAYYHWLVLFPVRLGLYHTFGYAFALTKKDTMHWSILSPLFFGGLLTIAGHVWAIWHFWGTPLAFGLIWFDIFIAQWCNLVLLNQTITERYCYLPAIGLMFSLSYALQMFFPHQVARDISYCIITAYAVKLFYYLPAYKNMEKYVDMNLHEMPEQFAAWNWAGILHREKGRIFSSMYHWAIGLRHNPTSFRLNFNMGMAFKQLGYLDQAQLYIDRAEQGLPPEVVKEHKETLDKERSEIKAMAGKVKPQRMNIPEDWKKGGSQNGQRIIDPNGETKSKGGIILP